MPSAALKRLVEERAPHRPWCAESKSGARVRPLRTALQAPYMQLNPPAHAAWIVLDIDRVSGALAWEHGSLPPPTYVAANRENGHAHIGYALASPVCTSDAARVLPLRFLASISQAYTDAAGADAAFRGPLAKNPLHEHWRLWEPANAPEYELSYLAEFVKLLPLRPRPAGLGRNCDLFDSLRVWAYNAVRKFWAPNGESAWRDACERRAASLNTFAEPLSPTEVRAIARSVARYTWRHFTPGGFRAVQAARGKKGGIASGIARAAASEDRRASARLMRARGMSIRTIASELNVPKSSVARLMA